MINPYQTLGIEMLVTDEQVRSAYLAKLRQFPPEHHAQQFQRIQQAYQLLETAEARLHYRLFHQQAITKDLIAEQIQQCALTQRLSEQQLRAVFAETLNTCAQQRSAD